MHGVTMKLVVTSKLNAGELSV